MIEVQSEADTFTVLGPPKTRPQNVTGPLQVASIPIKCSCSALFTATRFDGKARWLSKGKFIHIACPECGAIDKFAKVKLLAAASSGAT